MGVRRALDGNHARIRCGGPILRQRFCISATLGAALLSMLGAGALASPQITTVRDGFTRGMGDPSRMMLCAISTSDFAHDALRGEIYEVRAGELAQSRAASTAVRQFAADMMTAHAQSAADLSDALAQASVEARAPVDLDVRRKGLLSDLRASGGAEFDRRYIGQQIAAHKQALELLEAYASSGENAVLQRAAAELIPQIEQELETAKALPKP
jgi:putative membrane protein